MFKVLPQMHRLVEQVCSTYGVEIAATVVDKENAAQSASAHFPYYIVKLAPNEHGWRYISCRPHKGRYMDYSKSNNNVTVVALGKYDYSARSSNVEKYAGIASPSAFFSAKDSERREVLPSWRGKLVTENELNKHQYQISRGYMLLEAGPDLIEQFLIHKYEQQDGGRASMHLE